MTERLWGKVESQPIIVPRIFYDFDLFSQDCPYRISVDSIAYGQLLQSAGLTGAKTKDLNLVIKRKPGRKIIPPGTLASYSILSKTIEIYGDAFWERKQRSVEDLKRYVEKYPQIKYILAEGEVSDLPSRLLYELARADNWLMNSYIFSGFVSSKRLRPYLQDGSIDEERKNRTIERLVQIRTKREINDALAHEINHVKEATVLELAKNTGAYVAVAAIPVAAGVVGINFLNNGLGGFLHDLVQAVDIPITAAIGTIASYPIFYKISPLENKARKFGKEYSGKSSIIRFSAK